jgi:tetratricopeptide (TPR) repeat protein
MLPSWDAGDNLIDFGDMPEEVNALLQEGVIAYRSDQARAEALFRQALNIAPQTLPGYFCLYKIHTYRGRLDDALACAEAGLAEAARQASLDPDMETWPGTKFALDEPGRFALYTLKALAFIRLKRHEHDEACRILDILSVLDPIGLAGWQVIESLGEAVWGGSRYRKQSFMLHRINS